jgi:hypothetical protein
MKKGFLKRLNCSARLPRLKPFMRTIILKQWTELEAPWII